MKTCARCDAAKDVGEFYRQAARPDGRHPWCKSCCREYNKAYLRDPKARARRLEWRRENEKYERPARIEYRYGLSPVAYSVLLSRQDHRCAICRTDIPGGRWNTWHVDHDHYHCPGKRACLKCVRGLLCHSCNVALGHFDEDPTRLILALYYLGVRVRGSIAWWHREDKRTA